MNRYYVDQRTRWQRFHDDHHGPLFVTDNGPPCERVCEIGTCGINSYGFKVINAAIPELGDRKTSFVGFCYGCHGEVLLDVVDWDGTAAGISSAMRAQRTQRDQREATT